MGERSTVYSPLSSVPVGGPRRPGRRGKERPEPSGSLPWDTSCTALGPRRSPHLNGSLPRLPAEVYAAGDIRHPRPARPAPPRSVLARLGRGLCGPWQSVRDARVPAVHGRWGSVHAATSQGCWPCSLLPAPLVWAQGRAGLAALAECQNWEEER